VHHRRGLRRLLKDDVLLEAIEHDWTSAGLDARRSAMLQFAVKLTTNPGAMDRNDAQSLRDVEFSDRDILDITEVVAYYAYANRIADGLGIETEPWIP
jgi:uncharacterized peroxidase-related enzyme